MSNNTQHQLFKYRKVEGLALLSVTLVLVIGFLNLNNARNDLFETIEKGYENKTVVNLDKDFSVNDLTNLFVNGNYISNQQDAGIIAEHISKKLNSGTKLPNLGTLNKEAFFVKVSDIDSIAGNYFRNLIDKSRSVLQMPADISELDALYSENNVSEIKVGDGDCEVSVTVYQKPETGRLPKILKKLHLKKDAPVTDGVWVQLKEYWQITPDSLQINEHTEYDSIVAYAKTNSQGKTIFKGLQSNKYYSVLPIKKNHEYGAAQGTSAATQEKGFKEQKNNFVFTENEHQIKIFDSSTYQQLKAGEVLTVQTPQAYRDTFISYLLWFFVAWWILNIFLSFLKNQPDQLLLPLLMTLTGIGTLVMYAIHEPLTDNMEGNGMVTGTLFGLALYFLLSVIYLDKLFDGRCRYKFLKLFASTTGHFYLYLGFLLLLLLNMFGYGPEGSGVEVNLPLFIVFGLPFQPSEIIKFLVIIFFAFYFSRNVKYFQETVWQLKIKRIAFVFIGLAALMAGYMKTGDLGPAMVIGFAFIIIYSMANRDSIHLILGTASYIALLLFVRWVLKGSGFAYLTISFIWCIAWISIGIIYSYIKQKKTYESALFLNFIIAVFVFGSSLFSNSGFGERLQNRTAMSIFGDGIWNNEVQGGDQVAQGLWGLATGGMTGQGLGNGNPNVIPAFHTDMILASIGEELGWLCLLLIVVCLTLLIHRSWLIGRKAGKGFLFYLATGIAIVTGVQFLVISLGSTGLIPLTGISVPFLSSGMVSMIINVVAFGLVFSISQEKGDKELREEINKKYDNAVTIPVLLTYFGLSALLLGRLFWYQCIQADNILIQPALVTNRTGDRVVEYNPRINIMIRELGAANIYDRHDELLATSERDLLKRYEKDKIIEESAQNEIQRFKRRYYPFGNNLIFWTGDFNNTRYIWNENRGYIAERRHLAELRGFQNRKPNKEGKYDAIYLKTSKYKLNRFLPEQPKEYEYASYNYSDLLPSLKAGIHSNETEKLKKKQQDVHLTVDARLQTEIQNAMSQFFQTGNYQNMKKLRASVVVLNAGTGELLCSANYPLPNVDTLKIKPEKYNDIEGTSTYNFSQAYTDMDLGISYPTPPGSTAKVISALAGFIKAGESAANKIYNINPVETIYSGEPGNRKSENVGMEKAIVESSNIYFINLVNDLDLYEQLRDIYSPAGIGVDGITPYFIENRVSDTIIKPRFSSAISMNRDIAIPQYKKYREERAKGEYKKMNNSNWGWAWGQGTMAATPLAMARAYSIVANNGQFIETQYVMNEKAEISTIVSGDYTKTLTTYMEKEAKTKGITGIAAKTGTPERVTRIVKRGRRTSESVQNDGWFIFFRNSEAYEAPITVAIRIERLDGGGSQRAVNLAKDILKVITKRESEIKK
jgi:cell division protein FtsW (lipid II flippase)/cell division protein FtsI/penicillin-binding protein 2